jgi:hypothetical protein
MSSSAVPPYPQSFAASVIYLARGLSIKSATVGIPSVIVIIDSDSSPFYFKVRRYCLNFNLFFFLDISIKA